ncbi:MAG: hypothetical protein ABFR33_02100 [Verrucomicrobiota bacterium]
MIDDLWNSPLRQGFAGQAPGVGLFLTKASQTRKSSIINLKSKICCEAATGSPKKMIADTSTGAVADENRISTEFRFPRIAWFAGRCWRFFLSYIGLNWIETEDSLFWLVRFAFWIYGF